MSTTTWDLPQIDVQFTRPETNSVYTTGLKRAATITVTGYRARSPPSHRMNRPVSMLLGNEAAKHASTLSAPPFFIECKLGPRRRSLAKDDPFVVDHSDSTESVDSSDNGDHAHSDAGKDSTHTEDSTPSSEVDEPVLRANLSEPFQQPPIPFPSPKPRPASLSFDTPTTMTYAALDTPVRTASRENVTQTPSPQFITPKRVRPASVAIMTTPPSRRSIDSHTQRSRLEFSTPPTSPPQHSRSPVRHVSSPSATAATTQQTPTSIMRRLSRRISLTPGGQLQPLQDQSPTKPSINHAHTFPLTLTNNSSFLNQQLPHPVIPPVPSADQLASLDRRNIQMNTQIMRTPPQMRARSNTAPRAASGARRCGMFPNFSGQDGDPFGLIEEDDTLLAEENAAATVAAEADISTATESAQTSTADSTDGKASTVDSMPPSPTKQKKERFAQRRLSGFGARLGGSTRGAQAVAVDGHGERCDGGSGSGSGNGPRCNVM